MQEKVGFKPHHVVRDRPRPLMGDARTEHANLLTRAGWELGQHGNPPNGPAR